MNNLEKASVQEGFEEYELWDTMRIVTRNCQYTKYTYTKYKMKYCIINHRDNKIESYWSSLDGSDDNFNFIDDYNDDDA